MKVLREKGVSKLTTIILAVPRLLDSDDQAKAEIRKDIDIADGEIARGQDVLIMTSRDLVTGEDERKSLGIGSTVAKALVTFLVDLKNRPRYIIAKVS